MGGLRGAGEGGLVLGGLVIGESGADVLGVGEGGAGGDGVELTVGASSAMQDLSYPANASVKAVVRVNHWCIARTALRI